MCHVKWEVVREDGTTGFGLWRARIASGWLVAMGQAGRGNGLCFVPDAAGQWGDGMLEEASHETVIQTLEASLGERRPADQ
ncbi:MAG TPA: hypothetical protein VGO93_28950 [Candidatus Xenobia bacterium]|jgi:hypothetical protein